MFRLVRGLKFTTFVPSIKFKPRYFSVGLTENEREKLNSIDKGLMHADLGPQFEEWVSSFCIAGNYYPVNQLLGISNSPNIGDGKVEVDLALYGGLDNWNKVKEAKQCVRCIETRPPKAGINHILVGQLKLSANAVKNASHQWEQLVRVGKEGDDKLEVIPVAIINGPESEFNNWYESDIGQEWFKRCPEVNVMHFPYNSLSYVFEKQLENEALMKFVFGRLVENSDLDMSDLDSLTRDVLYRKIVDALHQKYGKDPKKKGE